MPHEICGSLEARSIHRPRAAWASLVGCPSAAPCASPERQAMSSLCAGTCLLSAGPLPLARPACRGTRGHAIQARPPWHRWKRTTKTASAVSTRCQARLAWGTTSRQGIERPAAHGRWTKRPRRDAYPIRPKAHVREMRGPSYIRPGGPTRHRCRVHDGSAPNHAIESSRLPCGESPSRMVKCSGTKRLRGRSVAYRQGTGS